MKVKELVEKLQKEDQEKDVVIAFDIEGDDDSYTEYKDLYAVKQDEVKVYCNLKQVVILE